MTEKVFTIEKIREILPHRYPFLLVDRVVHVQKGHNPSNREGQVLKAIKNVTINEEFFNGHFPNMPIMPGVLILEAMAQVGALANYSEGDKEHEFRIASINNAKFRAPVVPGDQLLIIAKIEKDKGKMKKIKCSAEVEGQVVAEAEVLALAQEIKQS